LQEQPLRHAKKITHANVLKRIQAVPAAPHRTILFIHTGKQETGLKQDVMRTLQQDMTWEVTTALIVRFNKFWLNEVVKKRCGNSTAFF
jgi:hypothetical protein